MTGTLALTGAAAGGVAGYLATPDITGVIVSLAVAGFGLGGALGVLFAGGWRSPKPPKPVEQRAAAARAGAGTRAGARPGASPPDGGEPGWYAVPDGTKRYWNGEAWTTHVWRERQASKSAPDTSVRR